jgi:S1-C subfamily serine protease
MFKRWTGLTLFVVAILALTVGAALAQETTPEPAPPEAEITPEAVEPEPAGPGYLGIGFEPAVIITQIMEGSPAEEAGLLVGDRIVAVNDEPVNADTLTAVIGSYSAGETITLSVERDGEMLEIELTLAERPLGFVAPRERFQQRLLPQRDFEQFRLMIQPFLGVYLELVDDAVVITRVEEGSPAQDAGLLADDVIVSVDGETVSTVEAVADAVRSSAPGAVIVLGIERDGEALEVEATLGGPTLFDRQGRPFGQTMPMPRGEDMRPFRFEMMPVNRAYLGVQFEIVDEDIAAENDLNVTEGALIVAVMADSPAEEAGLLAGDVVVSVDGDAVDADNTLADRIAAYESGDTITLLVIRDGSGTEIEVTLAERSLIPGSIITVPPIVITPEPEPETPEVETEASV